MIPIISLVVLLVPVLAGALLFVPSIARSAQVTRLALALAALSFGASLVVSLAVMAGGATSITLFGAVLRLDAIGAVLSPVIGFVGLAIVNFSIGYLSGEARRPGFLGLLLLTLFSAQLLVVAGDVVTFAVAWVAMSLPIHQLLTYTQRPAALVAARMKFAFARSSDLALFVAFGLLIAATGTTDMTAIGASASLASPLVGSAALLLTVAILLRSAQLPTHAWLLRAIEAPTPVSAVLHAGVVNAGGILALRFANVLSGSALAMTLLAVISGISLLVALGAMGGEQRIKSRLAWSTVAQMAFMLLQCSLGLFGLALLHIAAHALYKSFAFLNAGTLVAAPRQSAINWSGVLLATCTFGIVTAIAFPYVTLDPAALLIGAIFVAGLGLFGSTAAAGSALLARAAAAAVATLLWLGLHAVADLLVHPHPAQLAAFIVVAAIVGLATLAAVIGESPLRSRPWVKAMRLHLRNGLYVDLFVENLSRPRLAAPLAETAK